MDNKRPLLAHVMMESPFQIGMGYQENYLASKHAELGYEVHIISTSDGVVLPIDKDRGNCYDLVTTDGLHIHYLPINKSWLRKIPVVIGWIRGTIGLRAKLEMIKPSIIFMHGICRYDNIDVINYCKHNTTVRLYADNHSDFYNTPTDYLGAKIYRMGVGRYIGNKLNKYAKRVWGVTPWRVEFQEKIYHINPKISSLLFMGGDEKQIQWSKRNIIRQQIRSELGISNDAFTIITGGKINKEKNIHILIEAFSKMKEDIHLIIFGKFESDIDYFSDAINDERIHYVGWIKPNKANDYFLASDLACFPGTHSVLWEQACACGLPAIFKDWNGGFSHVDVGGNSLLLKDITEDTLCSTIHDLVYNKKKYEIMKNVAETKARNVFSYKNIAKRSIEMQD